MKNLVLQLPCCMHSACTIHIYARKHDQKEIGVRKEELEGEREREREKERDRERERVHLLCAGKISLSLLKFYIFFFLREGGKGASL